MDVHEFDPEHSIAIVDRIDYDLNGWLSRQYRKPGQCRQQWLAHWTSAQDPYRWWKAIRSDFLNVFGQCVRGLRNIHKEGMIHGRIRDGIVITWDHSNAPSLRGMLYNMVEEPTPDTDIEEAQRKDIEDLRDLILRVVNYPFVINYTHNQGGHSFTAPANPPEINHFCLSHLNDWFDYTPPQCLPYRLYWALNPVIFWNHQEMINLLETIHRILFICFLSPIFLMNVESNFIEKTWANKVTPPMASRGLMAVRDKYKRYDPPIDDPYVAGPYVGMKKLLFWYNCMEYRSSSLPLYSVDRHLAILEVVPDLIPEVVATVHGLLSSNWNQNVVEGLFRGMGWNVDHSRGEDR